MEEHASANTMNAAIFINSTSELHRSVNVMIQNLTYVLNELQTSTLAESFKNEIIVLCQAFRSTLYDVNKEICNLEDRLGMHPDDEHLDPSIVNADPRVAMDFIDHLIIREEQAMHRLVVELQTLADLDKSVSLVEVKVPVMESAANILNAYADVRKQFGLITEHLGKVDSA